LPFFILPFLSSYLFSLLSLDSREGENPAISSFSTHQERIENLKLKKRVPAGMEMILAENQGTRLFFIIKI